MSDGNVNSTMMIAVPYMIGYVAFVESSELVLCHHFHAVVERFTPTDYPFETNLTLNDGFPFIRLILQGLHWLNGA